MCRLDELRTELDRALGHQASLAVRQTCCASPLRQQCEDMQHIPTGECTTASKLASTSHCWIDLQHQQGGGAGELSQRVNRTGENLSSMQNVHAMQNDRKPRRACWSCSLTQQQDKALHPLQGKDSTELHEAAIGQRLRRAWAEHYRRTGHERTCESAPWIRRTRSRELSASE